MSNKYEQLVEFIINDETDKARALFHKIVVEKSRDIYESLVEEEDLDEVGGNEVEGLVRDVQMDEEGISEDEEEFGDEDSEEDEGDFDHEEFGGEEQEEGELEDRVVDLESAIDELKAEFDALMADEEHEPEHHNGIDDPDFSEIHGGEEDYGQEDEMEGMMYESAEEDDEEEDDEEEDLEESVIVKEYVNKVGTPYSGDLDGKEGKSVGTGARTQSVNPNTKNPVAGKNPLSSGAASARNIATGKANKDPNGTSPAKEEGANAYKKGETQQPLASKDGGYRNQIGGNEKYWSEKETAGHGAEKVGGKEGKLAGNDGSRPIQKTSVIKTTPR